MNHVAGCRRRKEGGREFLNVVYYLLFYPRYALKRYQDVLEGITNWDAIGC